MSLDDSIAFLAVAKCGRSPGARLKETRAATIARFLSDNLDAVSALNETEIAGICTLMREASAGNQVGVQSALEEAGFRSPRSKK